jgi:hypothetical protein
MIAGANTREAGATSPVCIMKFVVGRTSRGPSKACVGTCSKKMRPRSDAATDGDRLERVICDGGPIKRSGKLVPQYNGVVTALLSTGLGGDHGDAGGRLRFNMRGLRKTASLPSVRAVCDRRQTRDIPPPCRTAASRCDWFRACASTRAGIRPASPPGRHARSGRGRRLFRARARR